MPKQWKLITCYIIFIYLVLVGIIEYTKRHPLQDGHPVAAPSTETPADKTGLDSAREAQ